MSAAHWLQRNLTEVLSLPEPAVEWLLSVWNCFQVFDDAADGDPIDRQELNDALWQSMVGFYQNPFFVANAPHLVPVMAVCILKWQASDHAERKHKPSAMSYAWRAGFYDLVLSVVCLCHGQRVARDNAHLVMELYGETYEDYLAEFKHA